jgi:hypothetical protein
MKKNLAGIVLFLTIGTVAYTQDCTLYSPAEENTVVEYKQFNKKGSLTGSSVQKIDKVEKSSNGIGVTVTSESFDSKGKSLGTSQLKLRCEGGVYYIDMKNYLNQQSTESFKDMEMKVEGGNLELPANLKAGDILEDGDLKISYSGEGMPAMTMTINISNRKVESAESITTPAGTFDCFKITFDMATKMMMTVKAKGAEWYAKGVGMVKSESYSTSGDLMGYSLLSSIKR